MLAYRQVKRATHWKQLVAFGHWPNYAATFWLHVPAARFNIAISIPTIALVSRSNRSSIIVETNSHRVFNSRSFECPSLKKGILSMEEKKGEENWGGKSWRWRRLANSICSTKARKGRRIFARRRIRWDISSVNEREAKGFVY